MANSIITTSPFLGGLNTELNGVTDSTVFTRDELNMMIRQDNTRSRRPGVDYEELFSFNNFGKESVELDMNNKKLAFSCIEWTDINSPDESQTYTQIPYIVCQVGGYIIFFENKGAPYSGNQKDFVINLANYRIDTTDNVSYQTERCKFTTAYGCLFITSKAIKPIRLKSAQEDTHTWTPTSVLPHCRISCGIYAGRFTNFGRGFVDNWWFTLNGVKIFTMTAAQQAARYPVSSLTQGVVGLTSTQFANAWNSLPSATRLGITCTPKYANAYPTLRGLYTGTKFDEGAYYTPPDYLDFTAPAGSELSYRGISIGWGGTYNVKKATNSYNNTAILAGGNTYVNQTDLTLNIRDTSVGANDYLSNEATPEKTSYAHLYNLLNQGWSIKLLADYYIAQSPASFPGNNLAQQYLKDKTTEAFKPTTLINTTFGDTPAARGHFILDFFNQNRAQISSLYLAMDSLVTAINDAYSAKSVSTTVTLADILDTFEESVPTTTAEKEAMALAQVPVVKPRRPYVTDMCSYAGRIFYLCGDVLLYSQIIAEDTRKAAYCYSEADPTSEEISDVVETDGGMISLPEIGEGLKLQQFGTYLMVFGTRGNMLITGTANNNFTATAYTTGTLPAAPTQSPDSFVETEYGVFYWGTTGIQLVAGGENGISAKDLSTERILTWFGKLSDTQHQYCKGIYSSSKKKVYWFFPSDDEKPRRLDRVLVFDVLKNAFMPHQIVSEILDETGAVAKDNLPEIVGGVSIKVPFKNVKEYPVEIEGKFLVDWYGYTDIDDNVVYSRDSVAAEGDNIYNSSKSLLEVVDIVTGDYITTVSAISTETAATIVKDSTNYYVPLKGTASTSKERYVYTADNVPYGTVTASFDATKTVTVTKLGTTTTESFSFTAGTTSTRATVMTYERDDDEDTQTTVTDTNTYEVVDENGIKILADDPIESEEFTYESSLLLCLDVNNAKVTFGDFRNNLMRDWNSGDWEGAGYSFDSYLISHPMNAVAGGQDIVHRKNMPYLISYFKRTETGPTTNSSYVYPSKCQGSVLWDWRTNGNYGKWDSPQELYRPNKREIFSEGYVVTKTNIRGLGRAYQIKLESVDDNQFIIEALCSDLMNDGRI